MDTELSEAARAICAKHWGTPDRRCMRCPIERECSAPCATTRLAIAQHAQRLNAAALRVLQ